MIKQLLRVAALLGVLVTPFVFADNSVMLGKTSAGVVKEIQVNSSGQPVIAPLTAENQSLGADNMYEKCSPNNITASAQISSTPGAICGIFVSASTTCTLKLWDSLTATGTVFLGTTATLVAPSYFPLKGYFTTGLYATLANTCDVTIYTQEAP